MLLKNRSHIGLSERSMLLLFCVLWLLLNLIQGHFTQLAHDEAYYWTWSKHMDWGFYEHPPMVALFIKIGGLINSQELGVRLITSICNSVILYLVYVKLIKRDLPLYIMIITSMFLAHVGGFMTAPDSPLFFFTGLFFIKFKDYLNHDTSRNLIWMTLIIAAMMYSKYHAVLIIVFSFLINFSLLKRRSFWLITFGSLILYTPHLIWLFNNGEAGLTYALSDRFQEPMNIKVILNYVVGQLAIFGPFLGIVFIYASLKHKVIDQYQKTLKALVILVFLYFFIWSFKGSVQANWTATLCIPILVLSHAYIGSRKTVRKWVTILWIPSLAVLLLLRCHIMFDILPLSREQNRGNEFFGWKEYAQTVDSISNGTPVLAGGYQNASKLWFYRNERTITINNDRRVNQFHLWKQYQQELVDSSVVIISNSLYGETGRIDERGQDISYLRMNSYRSYREAELELIHGIPDKAAPNASYQIRLMVKSPPDWCMVSHRESDFPPALSYDIYDCETGEMLYWRHGTTYFDHEVCGDSLIDIDVLIPKITGEFEIVYRISSSGATFWGNDCRERFSVE